MTSFQSLKALKTKGRHIKASSTCWKEQKDRYSRSRVSKERMGIDSGMNDTTPMVIWETDFDGKAISSVIVHFNPGWEVLSILNSVLVNCSKKLYFTLLFLNNCFPHNHLRHIFHRTWSLQGAQTFADRFFSVVILSHSPGMVHLILPNQQILGGSVILTLLFKSRLCFQDGEMGDQRGLNTSTKNKHPVTG